MELALTNIMGYMGQYTSSRVWTWKGLTAPIFALLEHCPESMMLEKPQMKDHSERDPAVGLSQPTLPLNSAAAGANPRPLTNPKTHKK